MEVGMDALGEGQGKPQVLLPTCPVIPSYQLALTFSSWGNLFMRGFQMGFN